MNTLPRIYMGLDESNHGRKPEVFVLAMTKDVSLTKEGQFPKSRSSSGATVDSILEDNSIDFVFTILFQENLKEFASYETRTEALKVGSVTYSFFSHLQEQDKLPSKQNLFIDGLFGNEQMKAIKAFFQDQGLCTPVFKKKADKTYPIVNAADVIANRLYRDIASNGNKPGPLIGKHATRQVWPKVSEDLLGYLA